MKPYAIARIEYKPPSEASEWDFGRKEYEKAKRRCDRARIEDYIHAPLGLPCFAHDQKDAVLEFDTKEKFDAFNEWMDAKEIPFQSAHYDYPQKEPRPTGAKGTV